VISPTEGIVTPLHGGSYWLQPNATSLMWFMTKMPASGLFVDVHLHAHHINDNAFYMFAGVTPTDLGLNRGTIQTSFSAIPLVLEDVGMCKASVLRIIRSHNKSASTLLCHAHFPGLQYVDNAGVVPGLYGRLQRLRCRNRLIGAHEPITFLAFHGPVDIQRFTYKHDIVMKRLYNHFHVVISYDARTPSTESNVCIGGHHASFCENGPGQKGANTNSFVPRSFLAPIDNVLGPSWRKTFFTASQPLKEFDSISMYQPELVWGNRSAAWDRAVLY